MRPATGTNEGERVEFLRKKIKRLRMTAIELVAELEGLGRVGHARTGGGKGR